MGLNKYNAAITQFIEKYSVETRETQFICKICGQLLLMKEFVEDGRFNNLTERFVTSYSPLEIPLEEIHEHKKYALIIKSLENLIKRVSLITNTNMLIGHNESVRQKKKVMIKNIIDLIVKHSYVNLRKTVSENERIGFFSKRFNIDYDFSGLFYFELDDSIFNTQPGDSEGAIEINRAKYNNVILYFILMFITELNGLQIVMMYSDNVANIYTYLKYGDKLFGNLLLKKNISDMETVPITNYPVLCYLIFTLSYFLIKYGIYYYPSTSKSYNPAVTKIIANSIVELFDSISMDAGKMPDDYVYMLTVSKLYSQLNGVFKSNEIINILKTNHAKYDKSRTIDDKQVIVTKRSDITYNMSTPVEMPNITTNLPSFKDI